MSEKYELSLNVNSLRHLIGFSKYEACGNDFIIIDNRLGIFKPNRDSVSKLCDRNKGIGGDGLILLENEENVDFKMSYFNSDGNLGSLCGNGSRCIAAFSKELGIIENKAIFSAADGVHLAYIRGETIEVKMKDVVTIQKFGKDFFLDTGSPHYVRMVEKLSSYPVFEKGREIRNQEPFSSNGGTNVNFIEYLDDHLWVRTYERGVENETLSCGTGVTAAALVCSLYSPEEIKENCKIKTKGGNFSVKFHLEKEKFTNIWLSGPARCSFKGSFDLENFT